VSLQERSSKDLLQCLAEDFEMLQSGEWVPTGGADHAVQASIDVVEELQRREEEGAEANLFPYTELFAVDRKFNVVPLEVSVKPRAVLGGGLDDYLQVTTSIREGAFFHKSFEAHHRASLQHVYINHKAIDLGAYGLFTEQQKAEDSANLQLDDAIEALHIETRRFIELREAGSGRRL